MTLLNYALLAKISDDKIPLVLTFHPFNYTVRDVISRNFQILINDPETSAIFTDNPRISFRRNRNIRDNLVRSALDELCKLDLPRSVINWIIDFLTDRLQRIKLVDGCFSE